MTHLRIKEVKYHEFYLVLESPNIVIPVKAGIHLASRFPTALWIPAFAGMTIG